ncbi:MAG: branched-chain amino acid ABC transporter permease [Pelomonas sp.]|nr:branched-chain amino acid ABC transporter permease [Roseateles sp.]
MPGALLSHDRPRSRRLAALLGVTLLALALAPFLFPGARALDVAARVLVFAVLVGSYDLLLGYTGLVSFAHAMFFGIGAYGVAIACNLSADPGWLDVAGGVAAALALSALLALAIGLLSLRVRALFFAMITMAVAVAFTTLVSQLSTLTGGEDGLSFSVPRAIRPSTDYLDDPLLGADVDGRFVAYYLLFVAAVLLLLLLLRIVDSPFGRVLQAIRENDFRAEAIGYRSVVYRSVASVVAALFATLAGALLALWLRYNSPDTSMSMEVMLNLLLILVIGGMGTIWGALVGSALFLLAQSYLQDLMKLAGAALGDVPVLGALLAPERWLLWMGLLFVLAVYHFPAGIVGQLRAAAARRRAGGPR